MRRTSKIVLFTGIMAVLMCGCKNGSGVVQTLGTGNSGEMETQVNAEETSAEIIVEEEEKSFADNTATMEMLLEKNGDVSQYSYLTSFEIEDGLLITAPKSGTESSNGNELKVIRDGVCIEFIMNPKVRSGQEDYPVYERLRIQIESRYGGNNPAYGDLMMGAIEDISMESARTEVSYVDTSEKQAKAFDTTWYLIDLNKEKTLLLHVDISYADVTKETDDIIRELEAYYDIDILYDESGAKTKLSAYEENNKPEMKTVSYGTISFELPEDWKIDSKYSNSSMTNYSPSGTDGSGYGIYAAQYTYEFNLDKNIYFEQKDTVEKLLIGSTDLTLSDFEIVDAGQTFLGDSVKVTYTISFQGISLKYTAYIGVKGNQMNMVGMYGMGTHVAEMLDVLNNILKTGRCN
ncbi:MAG: hypothetical protein PUF12_00890 [Thermoflexaceae bacterium]|nr:hypothetical protein [Thermoflexaceae bacterium]